MRKITEIIIHCSDTQEGRDVTADEIRTWHMVPKEKGGPGFRDIGYHEVIRLDGTVEFGRPYADVGAHCEGHNMNSIGICYIGGRKIIDNEGNWQWADTRTEAQTDSLRRQLAWHLLKWKLTPACIHGHREYARKACPCFDVRQWVDEDFAPWFEANKEGIARMMAAAEALNILENYFGVPYNAILNFIHGLQKKE